VLRANTGAPLAWEQLRDEANHLGSANAFIAAVLAEAAAFPPLP
jgi:hypothetical protein